jgi:signal transduction histidine kinase
MRDSAHRPDDSKGSLGHTPPAVDRIHALLTELNTLLDGSLKAVAQARSGIALAPSLLASGAAGTLEQQLHAAAQRLEQMADLVHSAMQSASKPIGSPALHKSRPVTLGEAVSHAVDVLAPLAATHGVRVQVDVSPVLSVMPAGALYTVVLNGLQNALEAVARRSGAGVVTIALRPQPAPEGVGYGRDGRDWFCLEISDDGAGLPADPARCFDLGFTTKPRGSGVGLAVARNVVRGMGGTIDLSPREGAPGAVLRVRFPSLTSAANLALGGAA